MLPRIPPRLDMSPDPYLHDYVEEHSRNRRRPPADPSVMATFRTGSPPPFRLFDALCIGVGVGLACSAPLIGYLVLHLSGACGL